MAASKPELRWGFKTWADNKSLELRSRLGLAPYSPLKAADLCKIFEVHLITPENITLLSGDCLKTLCADKGKEHWSAVTIPKSPTGYVVIHNHSHSLARQESNIMHELAHIICGHDMQSIHNKEGLPPYMREFPTAQEEEAKWLGGCLQLPREALVWALQQGMEQAEIASYYLASAQMVRLRINMTGVSKQLKQYSK